MTSEDTAPVLSIIIVNWNTRDLLAQCIESIYAHPPDGSFDIWVVDNASADGSAEMVRQRFPQVHLIENSENVGFARANNQAIRASSGRYVLLLNSDTCVLSSMLDHLLTFVATHPRVGICGAVALNPDGSLQAGGNRFPSLISELSLLLGRECPRSIPTDNQPAETDWVGGACLLARRSMIEQIGLLDEQFFMYCEETDWCWRAKKAGWDIFLVPQARYIHLGARSTIRVRWRMLAQLYESKGLLLRKHRGMVSSHVYRILSRIVFQMKILRSGS